MIEGSATDGIVEYPGELLIYDAGDMRTTFVSFWKAMALLQFGTCVAFLTPILYYNENQPNKTIRVLQAAGGESRDLDLGRPCHNLRGASCHVLLDSVDFL